MTATTTSLTEFLLARLNAEEATARLALTKERWSSRREDDPEYHDYGEFGWWVTGADVETNDSQWGKAVADHIARHDPARVLAECAAKRAIVEAHENERQRKDIYNRGHEAGDLTAEQDLRSRLDANVRWRALDDTLRALASVYADHPDFDPAWR